MESSSLTLAHGIAQAPRSPGNRLRVAVSSVGPAITGDDSEAARSAPDALDHDAHH